MPSARVRLIPVRPSTIISNHVNNSGSNLIIIRGVKFYFTSCVVDLEHDTARIAISAVSPVGDDASIFARVIGHPGVPILVSVVDEGHFDEAIHRHRERRNSVKRLSLLSLALAGRNPKFFDSAGGFVNSKVIPVILTSCNVCSGITPICLAERIPKIGVSVAIQEIAISVWTSTCLVVVTNNFRCEALRYDSKRDSLIVILRETNIGPWSLTMVIASVSCTVDHGESAHLPIVRSLKPEIPSAINSKVRRSGGADVRNRGRHYCVKMIRDNTGIVSRSSPVVAVVMIVVMYHLVFVVVLVDPHVADSMRLDDPGHSTNRNNLGVESNIQMGAWSVRLNVRLEVRINLLIVISTVGGIVLTDSQSNHEIALIQTGVRRSVVKVISNLAGIEPTVTYVKMSPPNLLCLRISQQNFHVMKAMNLSNSGVQTTSTEVNA
jgi:hypothetical protein